MGAAIAREIGIEAELIKGDRGIFDVAADGKIIYSKYESGDFPPDNLIIDLLRELREGGR